MPLHPHLKDLVRDVGENGLVGAAAAVHSVLQEDCPIGGGFVSHISIVASPMIPNHHKQRTQRTCREPPSMYSCTIETVPSVGFTYAS